MTLPRGRRLGIDVGSVRVGVAVCDPDGILATPVETVQRTADGGREAGADVRRVAAIAEEYEVVGVVIGLPRTLRNTEGAAVEAARAFGDRIAAAIAPIPVIYHDERLTTVTAAGALRDSGRKGKAARAVIDQAAAVAILQGWLDAERSRGWGSRD